MALKNKTKKKMQKVIKIIFVVAAISSVGEVHANIVHCPSLSSSINRCKIDNIKLPRTEIVARRSRAKSAARLTAAGIGELISRLNENDSRSTSASNEYSKTYLLIFPNTLHPPRRVSYRV